MLRNLGERGGAQTQTRTSIISKVLPLLACRVPDLQFDLLSVDLDSFNHEVHPDGGPLAWREHSLGKPPDKASLAHSRVTNQDNLQTNVQWWFVVRENYLASRIYIRTNLEQIFVIFHVLLSDHSRIEKTRSQ